MAVIVSSCEPELLVDEVTTTWPVFINVHEDTSTIVIDFVPRMSTVQHCWKSKLAII